MGKETWKGKKHRQSKNVWIGYWKWIDLPARIILYIEIDTIDDA